MTRREVLVAICESPGWAPPEASSSLEQILRALRDERLIASRIDGWEATPQALAAYPDFIGHGDLEDSTAADRAAQPASTTGPAWNTHIQQDPLVLCPGQRIEAPVVAPDLGGSLVLNMTDSFTRRVEVQVILRVRRLPDPTQPEVEP